MNCLAVFKEEVSGLEGIITHAERAVKLTFTNFSQEESVDIFMAGF
jgi:hypothetical protein